MLIESSWGIIIFDNAIKEDSMHEFSVMLKKKWEEFILLLVRAS